MKICQSCTINFNFTAQSRNGNNRLLTWLTSSSHSLYNCDLHFLSPVLSSRCVYFIYIYVYNIYFSIIVFITYYLYACIFIFIFIFILIFIFIFIYIYIYIYIYVSVFVYVCIIRVQCGSVGVSVLIAQWVIELGRWTSGLLNFLYHYHFRTLFFSCSTLDKNSPGKINSLV